MVKMPHWPIPYGSKDIKLGLKRTKELLERLGNPHISLPNVIHVAGTNGKGSTIAYLKAIFEQIGFDCNAYTSPHIYRFNERIVLKGKEIEDDYLHSLCEEVRVAAEDLQTTFFEATTVIAFLAMNRVRSKKQIVNLVEVGLGGRLDATNVLPPPLASIITQIDYDHVEFLGTSLAQIASEKAQILKPGSYGVVSWQYDEAKQKIKEIAAQKDVPLFCCEDSWNFEVTESGNFIYEDNYGTLELPPPGLLGKHQYINASTAVALMRTIPTLKNEQESIAQGIKNVKWPARMEHIISGRIASILPNGFELWVDGAHNTGGARMAALSISEMDKKMPTILINGRTANRDILGFLKCFKGIADEVYAVNVHSEPKSEKAENIEACAKKLGFKTYAKDSVVDAVAQIAKKCQKPSRILVCGSLYLAADILQANSEF